MRELTYCMNIHPGETWEDVFAAVRIRIPVIRKLLGEEDRPFGLGLRLSARAAAEIDLPAFKRHLRDHNLYVWTVNAFPYGPFHGVPVKQKVYLPDWSSRERADYTNRVVDILSELLPEGIRGSISTVPLGYGKGPLSDLLDGCLERIRRDIVLSLEPEPDCFLETTDEVIEFFARRPHHPKLGVCFDTCHQLLQFEDPAESLLRLKAAGIPIGKIQLSAAPITRNPAELLPFAGKTYLHQTRWKRNDGTIRRFPDLSGEVLQAFTEGEIRSHFHIPLYCAPPFSPEFVRAASDCNLEIETYTFDVLPPALRRMTVEESIAAEYRRVREQFSGV